jgi:SanA protein
VLLKLGIRLALLGVVAAAAANAWVLLAGREEGRPARADAALVLGASVRPDGRPSPILADRIAAAAALYREGRVRKVLVSGDNAGDHYDEPGTMRRELVRLGVPGRDVFEDHAGFDTWDSAQRARRVFGARSVIVVTQRFHMARAVFAARRAGLEAAGAEADPHGLSGVTTRLQAREALARVKVAVDALRGAQPRFLGRRIALQGDGRGTWSP